MYELSPFKHDHSLLILQIWKFIFSTLAKFAHLTTFHTRQLLPPLVRPFFFQLYICYVRVSSLNISSLFILRHGPIYIERIFLSTSWTNLYWTNLALVQTSHTYRAPWTFCAFFQWIPRSCSGIHFTFAEPTYSFGKNMEYCILYFRNIFLRGP